MTNESYCENEIIEDETPKNRYEYLVGKYWYFKEERADTTVEVYLKANDVFHEVIYRYDIVSCEIIQMCHTNDTNELEWFDYTKEQSFELAKYYDMDYKIPVDELKETTEEKFILAKQLSLL